MCGGGPLREIRLHSAEDAGHFYTGITDDLRARLSGHNSGEVPHTAKYEPRRIKSYVAFSDEDRALAFEKLSEVWIGPRLR